MRGKSVMNDSKYNELDHTCGVSDEGLSYRFKEAVRRENEIKNSEDRQSLNTILIRMLLM